MINKKAQNNIELVIALVVALGVLALFFIFQILKTEPIKEPLVAVKETTFQGFFSELFSGTGWKNEEKTTVYHDFKTLSISFPPDYEVEKIKEMEHIKAVGGNGREIILLSAEGELLMIPSDFSAASFFQDGFFSMAEEIELAVLDYDRLAGSWLIALVFDESMVIYGFNTEKLESWKILESSARLFSEEISLNCQNLHCFIGNGKRIWYFSALKERGSLGEVFPYILEEKLKEEEIISFRSGKTSDSWLFGLVTFDKEKEEPYRAKVYLCSQQLSDCQLIKSWRSEYKGLLHFGYSYEKEDVLAVYAAYFGQAYLISLKDFQAADYSWFFHQRVMEGRRIEGELLGQVRPEIFEQNNTWWIGSAPYSPEPKLLRISGRTGLDLTAQAFDRPSYLHILPGFEENIIYVVKGEKDGALLFRFKDSGFKKHNKLIWESSILNSGGETIIGGKISHAVAEKEGGDIKYFFSNDGGKSWVLAKENKDIWFAEPGHDFRWRAELYPAGHAFSSPNISLVSLIYYFVK